MVSVVYLFTALLSNLLPQPLGNLALQVVHVLQHVLQHNHLAHGAKLACLAFVLATTYNLGLVCRFGPATAVGVCLFPPLFHLHAEWVEDAGFARSQTGAFGPAVLGHKTMGEAGLAWTVGARPCLCVVFVGLESCGRRRSGCVELGGGVDVLAVTNRGSGYDGSRVCRWWR